MSNQCDDTSSSNNLQSQNPYPNVSTLHRNKSSLHSTTAMKSATVSTWNSTLSQDMIHGGSMSSLMHSNISAPNPPIVGGSEIDLRLSDSHNKVVSHGKPNLAPKPPTMNATNNVQSNNGQAAAGLKKLNVNGRPAYRAQSLRVARYFFFQILPSTFFFVQKFIDLIKFNRSPPVTPPCPPTESGAPSLVNNGYNTLKPNTFSQVHDAINKKLINSKNNAPQPPLGITFFIHKIIDNFF